MGGNGYYASLEDPRYSRSVETAGPTVDPAILQAPSPARTGRIWGSLFQSGTNYTLFTGGLAQLAEDGTTGHDLADQVLPYSYVGISPTEAWQRGFKQWRPKLSAFVNRALGAADVGRTPATRVEGPNDPARQMAIPITSFFDQFPKGTLPWYNRQPGYVTRWPSAPMTFAQMGGGG